MWTLYVPFATTVLLEHILVGMVKFMLVGGDFVLQLACISFTRNWMVVLSNSLMSGSDLPGLACANNVFCNMFLHVLVQLKSILFPGIIP